MELPKNIVQIGRPDKIHKVFVEDYVVSYMKQLNKACDGKAVGLALYGRFREEEACRYYFLYGAARIDGLEHRGPYLSQVEKEEIADVGRRHFGEYEFLAWCSIKGEPVEGFYIQMQGKGVEVNGYACFYEKNESMLNYMLLTGSHQKEEVQAAEKKEAEKPVRGDWKAADYIKPVEKPVRKKEPVKGMEYGKVAAAAAFLVLCVVGITTLNDYDKLEDLQVAARQVIASMSEQKLPDAEPDRQPEERLPDTGLYTQPKESMSDAGTDTGQEEKLPEELPGSTLQGSVSQNDISQDGIAQNEEDSDQAVSSGQTEKEVLPVSYTVVQGDTLISICQAKYGSLSRLQEICELNGITNADNIQIGQIILLP